MRFSFKREAVVMLLVSAPTMLGLIVAVLAPFFWRPCGDAVLLLPQAHAARERVPVVAQLCIRRQLLDDLRIPSAQHHVLRAKRVLHALHDVGHSSPPLLLP